MAQELKVIQDSYDFMLWVIQHTEKFPRHHRHGLGIAMENRLQRIMELLLRAKYTRDKAGFLNDGCPRNPLRLNRAGKMPMLRFVGAPNNAGRAD